MSDAELTTPAAPRIVVAPKARMTIYIVLLIISLTAILAGCLFLYLEVRAQGGFGTVQGRISAAPPAAQSLLAEVPSAHFAVRA